MEMNKYIDIILSSLPASSPMQIRKINVCRIPVTSNYTFECTNTHACARTQTHTHLEQIYYNRKTHLCPQRSHNGAGKQICKQACSSKTAMNESSGNVIKKASLGEQGWVQLAEPETEENSASFFR